jgi:enoyl-CoA hydratase
MDYKYLIKTIEGPLGIVTINNPKANALSENLVRELDSIIDEYELDKSIRVLVITGHGEKFFVAGADINEFLNKNTIEGRNLGRQLQLTFNKIENCSKPVIAAINGYCLGGGLELAMCCDIRYASENAEMGQPEIDLGLIPGAGGTQRLPRLIGKGKAKEMMFTGVRITAKEALEIQLIQKIVKKEELLSEVKKLGLLISKKSPIIIKNLKEVIDKGTETNLDTALVMEADKFGLCFSTNDKIEGVNAFLEKRSPNFQGN